MNPFKHIIALFAAIGRWGRGLFSRSCKVRSQAKKAYVLILVAILFTIGITACCLVTSVIGIIFWYFDAPTWLTIMVILAPALIGWFAIVFKTDVFNWFFIGVNPNMAIILASQLNRDKIPDSLDDRTQVFYRKSLREIGPGWHVKLPWEVEADKPIDLRSELLIGNSIGQGDPLKVYTQDGIELFVSWQTRLTPLVGYLCNHIRFTDEAQIAYFRAIFTEFLIGFFKLHTADQAFQFFANGTLVKLKERFNSLLGGKNHVDDRELERGMFSGDPEFRRIEYNDQYQKALQSKMTLQKVGDGMQEFLNKVPEALHDKVNPNVAMLLAAAAAGTVEGVTPILAVGFEGSDAESMGRTLATLQALRNKDNKQQKQNKGGSK